LTQLNVTKDRFEGKIMDLKFKIKYLKAVRLRYFGSNRPEKAKILDELCAVVGYNRKYAIRIMAIKHLEGKKRSGKSKVYSERSRDHLKRLWVLMGEMCSKKMVCAFGVWLEFYQDDDFDQSVKEELLLMSAATIDRYLKSYKATFARKKRAGTRPGKMFKNMIPLKPFDSKIDKPGHVEADTVAHCGNSLSGKFAWSLTFTDIYSGWTENRAIYGKDSDGVLAAIVDIQSQLPFPLLSFNTDNGTEFLNHDLYQYFSPEKNINFTRSRAYKKNDNCHVEQKNWTHVRETFGYERYEKEEQIAIMNEIYKKHLNVLYNFFVPQLKLKEKMRVGSKIVRKYDKPKTPFQRLLDSPDLTMGPKEELRRKYKMLNPFELRENIKKLFNQLKKTENNTESLEFVA
jgi:hypothetical protein